MQADEQTDELEGVGRGCGAKGSPRRARYVVPGAKAQGAVKSPAGSFKRKRKENI